MKALADALTALRFAIAFFILIIGFALGKDGIGAVVAATLIGWTSDIFDGVLARKSRIIGRTWLGENDFTADMSMVFAGFVYLVIARYIPFSYALVYMLVSSFLILYFRSKSVTELAAFPMIVLLFFISLREVPSAGMLYIAWVAVSLILFHRRFFGVVSEFFVNMRAVK
ncbi:MAG: CDP-alcohol phosphatidyltransferase family protein, partial [bacterium]